ncbi:TetR/AcrR family transcriptional regulator [Paenibacillus humicola]|uniref:TetR/AcrR family transcriptional regulator n=1 Tax=Paenibacillus humicola TaxID=3110540 RepID=UPI00237A53FF|nr:TetR/AcrR family transcriptional regulator [Paenibacillus humicola]
MDHESGKDLPRGVALSWGIEKTAQRGPKREMSLKQIVDAAIAIADRDGLPGVSMSRVAAALGYTSMSLYRYVPSKDDLMLLMQDAVCDIPVPPEEQGKDWREGMHEFVRAIVRCFREHPWFCDIPISGVPVTPNHLKIADWALRTMKGLPLTDHEKMSTVLLLTNYARVHAMFQRDIDRAVQSGVTQGELSGADYGAALRQLVTPDRFPHLHPIMAAGVYTGEDADADPFGDEFEFGFERILDGIGNFVAAKEAQPER